MTDFEIVLVDAFDDVWTTPTHKRRIALRIGGEDKDVVSLRVDSDQTRARQTKRWVETFNLDPKAIENKLRRVAITVTSELQKRQGEAIDAKLRRAGIGGAKLPPVTLITLDEARPVYGKWIADIDPYLLDVVFGTIMAHRLDGDPVWTFIIAAPGDSKTETLRSLSAHESIYALSSLTPGALISGYITDGGPDPSLLPKLDGKVLVVKDFTAVLTMPNEARGEVLGTLRDAYDGEACKAFGTGEVKQYKSRFGLLAAVTPVIESYWGVASQLGERFLRLRIRSRGRKAKVKRALANTNDETAMRRELSQAALGVLAQAPFPPAIPDSIGDRLIHLADFVSRARSEVSRDRQGVVQYIPAVEVGTRVGKALKKLAMGIAMARYAKAVDHDIYRIVRRVALDCVPSMRGRLLRVLWDCRGAHELSSNIADRAELGTDTAKVWLDDLRLLGIVDRACAGASVQAGYTWRLTGELQQTITLSGVLDDDDATDGPDPDSDPRDGVVGGVPPDSAPQTPGIEREGSGRSGVPNHLPPTTHVTVGDDSERREREAIMSVEAEAEAVAIRASGGALKA